jgi:hypothetical protein
MRRFAQRTYMWQSSCISAKGAYMGAKRALACKPDSTVAVAGLSFFKDQIQ